MFYKNTAKAPMPRQKMLVIKHKTIKLNKILFYNIPSLIVFYQQIAKASAKENGGCNKAKLN